MSNTRMMEVAIALAEHLPGDGWRVRSTTEKDAPVFGNGVTKRRITVSAEVGTRVRGLAFGPTARWWIVDDGRGFIRQGESSGPTALVKAIWPHAVELLPEPDAALVTAINAKRKGDDARPQLRAYVHLGDVIATLDPDPLTHEPWPFIEHAGQTVRLREAATVGPLADAVADRMLALHQGTTERKAGGLYVRDWWSGPAVPETLIAVAKGRSTPADDWRDRVRAHIEGESAGARSRRRGVMEKRAATALHLPGKGSDPTGREIPRWGSPQGGDRLALPLVRIAAVWGLGFGLRMTAQLLTGTDKGKSSIDRRITQMLDGADHLDRATVTDAIERAKLKWAHKATLAPVKPKAKPTPAPSRATPRGETRDAATAPEPTRPAIRVRRRSPAPAVPGGSAEQPGTAGAGLLGRALHGLDWSTPGEVYAELRAEGADPIKASRAVAMAHAQSLGAVVDVEQMAEELRVSMARPVRPTPDAGRTTGTGAALSVDARQTDITEFIEPADPPKTRRRGKFDPEHHFEQTWTKAGRDWTAPSGRIRLRYLDNVHTRLPYRVQTARELSEWATHTKHMSYAAAVKAAVTLEKRLDKPTLTYRPTVPAALSSGTTGTVEDPLAGQPEAVRDFVRRLPPRSQTFLDLVARRGRVSITEVMTALNIEMPKVVGAVTGTIGRWAPIRDVAVPYRAEMVDGVRHWVWTGWDGDRPGPAAARPAGTHAPSTGGAMMAHLTDAEQSRAAVRLNLDPTGRAVVAALPERALAMLQVIAGQETANARDVMEAIGSDRPRDIAPALDAIKREAAVHGAPLPFKAGSDRGERTWTWIGWEGAP